MEKSSSHVSLKMVAFNGALVAVAAVFIYALMMIIYTISRSSVTIVQTMPPSERAAILWANGFSIAYSIAVFSVLMAIPSAAAGSVAAIMLKKLLPYFNRRFLFRKAILISFVIALCLLTIMYLLLYSLLKEWMTFRYPETFLFWFVFPAFIFLAVCTAGGSKINQVLNTAYQNGIPRQEKFIAKEK